MIYITNGLKSANNIVLDSSGFFRLTHRLTHKKTTAASTYSLFAMPNLVNQQDTTVRLPSSPPLQDSGLRLKILDATVGQTGSSPLQDSGLRLKILDATVRQTGSSP